MPNSLNFYRAAHKMAEKAIEQAQEAYETVRSDPDTKMGVKAGWRRTFSGGIVRSHNIPTIVSAPDRYSVEVKDALSALYDARAVITFLIRHPNTPGRISRDRFQKELADIGHKINSMEHLKRAMSAK